MNEKDVKDFLEDFKKVDIQKKMDMWFYALEQIEKEHEMDELGN